MFFISWGSHGEQAQIGEEILHCSRCQFETHWSTMIEYRVRHIYWLLRWTTDRNVYRMCGNCFGVEPLDQSAVSPQAFKAAIPWLDRRGWTIGAGVVASLVGLGSLAAAQNASDNAAFIQAPRTGDIYEVDLARLSDRPQEPVMYSAMRVTEVGPDTIQFELADVFYDRLGGVQRDVTRGRVYDADYYGTERLEVPKSAIQRMWAEGVIIDIER